jgi:hypothetical protein
MISIPGSEITREAASRALVFRQDADATFLDAIPIAKKKMIAA